MFVFPFPVVSVSTGDRWVRVDGIFNLLPIKRLYFHYLIALCGVCDPGVIITEGIATALQRVGEGHQGTLGALPAVSPSPARFLAFQPWNEKVPRLERAGVGETHKESSDSLSGVWNSHQRREAPPPPLLDTGMHSQRWCEHRHMHTPGGPPQVGVLDASRSPALGTGPGWELRMWGHTEDTLGLRGLPGDYFPSHRPRRTIRGRARLGRKQGHGQEPGGQTQVSPGDGPEP